MPYGAKQAEKKRRIQEKILTKAMELLDDGSFFELTMPELCERLGVSVGMFYRQFPSKIALLLHGRMMVLNAFMEDKENWAKGRTCQEQVISFWKKVGETYACYGRRSILYYVNLLQEPAEQPWGDELYAFSDQLILSGVTEEGWILSREPREISRDLDRLVKGIFYVWGTENPAFDPLEKIDDLLSRSLMSLL